MDASRVAENKHHHPRQAGAKADKKKENARKKKGDEVQKHKDHRAFGVAKFGRAHRQIQRNMNLHHRKEHAPMIDRTPEIPPPVVVVVMGPPGSGKTSLIKSLVKKYTNHSLSEVSGPITVVTGKNRRITFFECPNELNAMIDLAKIADLVLLTVDASFGFEMETFEFLNILQIHGFPRVMGILTHLDKIRNGKKQRSIKKTLKQRFWVEIHDGAKLFYLSGLINGSYMKNEIHNLCLYLSRIKFRPLTWRNTHPYCLVDRYEDITPPVNIEEDPNCDRRVALFGFLRGSNLKPDMKLHVAGMGTFPIANITDLPDPVPLPESDPEKRKALRALNSKQTLLYAPMSNVGAILYDKDAVYINIPKVHLTRADQILAADRKPGDGEIIPVSKHHSYIDSDEEFDESDDESDEKDSVDIDSDEDAALLRGGDRGDRKLRSADGVRLLKGLQDVKKGIDERSSGLEMSLFRGGKSYRNDDLIASDSDDDSDDDSDGSDPRSLGSKAKKALKMPQERQETDSNGRVRRRAVFDEDDEDDDDEDDDGEDDDEEMDDFDEDDDNDDNEEDSEEEGGKWKSGLGSRAVAALRDRQSGAPDLMQYVYSLPPKSSDNASSSLKNKSTKSDDESDGDDFFRIRKHDSNTFQEAKVLRGSSALDKSSEKMNSHDAESDFMDDPVNRLLNNDDEEDTSFLRVSARAGANSIDEAAALNDSASIPTAGSKYRSKSLCKPLRNRFVTGDWGGKKITGLHSDNLDNDEDEDDEGSDNDDSDDDDESDLDGDFEDLEGKDDNPTSLKEKSKSKGYFNSGSDEDEDMGDFDGGEDEEDEESGSDDDDDEDGDSSSSDEPLAMTTSTHNILESRARAAAEKARMKAEFDAEYDAKRQEFLDRKNHKKGMSDPDSELTELQAFAKEALEESEEVKQVRQELQVRQEITKTELQSLNPHIRRQIAGFHAGLYVRIVLEGVPVEFTRTFRPRVPVLLGGLLASEDGARVQRMRVKKHRWHPRILKSNDALVFSMGWQRFQGLPIFSIQDHNERHRFLKYTPEHMHCTATMYGPPVPPNTGVIAFRSIDNTSSAFRVALTGVVLEQDATTTAAEAFVTSASGAVMKKLKLTGVPFKIFKNTAFIRGMFNSELEVAKFEGAAIRTVSGIRGTIKKAVRDGPTGTFRATFEDRILNSDIVFLRTWVPVRPTEFFNPVCSLLDAPEDIYRLEESERIKKEKAAELKKEKKEQKNEAAESEAQARQRRAVPDSHERSEFAGKSATYSDEEGDDDDDDENASADDNVGDEDKWWEADKEKPAAPKKSSLLLMKTNRELRQEQGIANKAAGRKDSLYTKIERPEVRKFNPLHIPRKLQAQLPFSAKPKQQQAAKKKEGGNYFQKRAALLDKDELAAQKIMQNVFTVANEKKHKEKVAREEQREKFLKKKGLEEESRAEKRKEVMKKRYRKESLNETNKRLKKN